MHILILNWRDPKNPLSGGAEIVTLMHAQAWIRAGYRVTWFASHFDKAPRHEIINGVNIVRYGTGYTVHFAALFYYLFSGNKFDLVIDEIHGIPFFTPLYVRKPIIAFIHEIAGEIWDYVRVFPLNELGKLIESSYFLLYKNILFWTDAPSTVDELAEHGIPRSRCVAIPCPANNKPLNKLPRKEHEPTFIFVSRLVRMKGVEDVIRAFWIVKSRYPKAKLWIVGDGDISYLQHLHRFIDSNKIERIQFFGRVTNSKKLELMRRAHILLHASVKEGWGLVVSEAASQATPSIVYNVAGLRDSVKNNRTGIVLDSNTPEEMSRQTSILLDNKKRYEFFQKNCLEISNSYNWSDATKQSIKLLEKFR